MKNAFAEMLAGHVFFIASGIAYTIHWYLHFKKPGPLAGAFIAASLIAGLAGVALLFLSLGGGRYGLWPVPLACAAAFVTVLLLTSIVWKRPFTSELPLLLIWAGLESCALLVAAQSHFMTGIPLGISAACNALAASAGLLCYSGYYLLAGNAQFVDGLIPYFAISLSMAVTTVFLILGI